MWSHSSQEKAEWISLLEFSIIFLDSNALMQYVKQAEQSSNTPLDRDSIGRPFNVDHTPIDVSNADIEIKERLLQ